VGPVLDCEGAKSEIDVGFMSGSEGVKSDMGAKLNDMAVTA